MEGSHGASFRVLDVLNKEMDKTHRKGHKGLCLLKTEKRFALQGEEWVGEKPHDGNKAVGH